MLIALGFCADLVLCQLKNLKLTWFLAGLALLITVDMWTRRPPVPE